MPTEAPDYRRRRARLLWAASAFLALPVMAACSTPATGDGPGAAGVLPSASSPPPASSAPPTTTIFAPLTGVSTTAAVAARPAVAVPVTVTAGRPPTGLGSADIVYAEWDGSSSIRLVALFQSQDNVSVGPVAGLAPADAKLLPVVKPVVAAGPSYAKFNRLARNAGLNVASVGKYPQAYSQTTGVPYASTAALRTLALKGSLAPQNLFPLATAGETLAATGMKPATRFIVPSATRPVFSWAWDPALKLWRATVGGSSVTAANVVVLSMPYKTVLAQSPRGPAFSTASIFGSGNAYVVSGPIGAAGRWARNGPMKVTTIATPDGVALRFASGPTWVILVPEGNTWAVS